MRLTFQPAAEHGRRQVLTPQLGGRRRRTICARCAPRQRRRWPGGRAVRAACGNPRVCGLSALRRAPRFPGHRGACRGTALPVPCLAMRGIPLRGRRSRPRRVLVPRGGVRRARANAGIQASASAVVQACGGSVRRACTTDLPEGWADVPQACGTAVGGDCRAAAGRVNRADGVPRARLAVGVPVTCSALFLGVAPPLGFVTLEFARDRGEYALPQVFGNDPKVDPRRGPGRAGRTRNAAGKRRGAAVIYHAATPRRPAHERDTCLDSGTYIARLIQPKSHIVAMKLPKVHTPHGCVTGRIAG